VTKIAKLMARLQSIPTDMTWDELCTALRGCDFHEISDTSGSYRTFVDDKGRKIFLHKPHPGNTVKKYALRKVVEKLQEYKML
jgi:predicted RNA binding protein YcfA (HicA-like mRNA interferase family)